MIAEVTDVVISIPDQRKVRSVGLLCFADITLMGPGGIRIHGIKLLERSDGVLAIKFPNRWREVDCERCGGFTPSGSCYCIRCGSPSYTEGLARYAKDSDRYDIVHPLSTDLRRAIQRAIMSAYEQHLVSKKEASDGAASDCGIPDRDSHGDRPGDLVS